MGEGAFTGLEAEIMKAFEENCGRFSAHLDTMDGYLLAVILPSSFLLALAAYGTVRRIPALRFLFAVKR